MNTSGHVPGTSDAGFAFLEHTADVGLKVWGPSPESAFAQAAHGMYAIALRRDAAATAGPPTLHSVTVNGATWSDLLVNWLAELLFRFSVEELVAQEYSFHECAPPQCAAEVAGVYLDDESHIDGVEIKAVTYHRLEVDVQAERTTIQVVFDI